MKNGLIAIGLVKLILALLTFAMSGCGQSPETQSLTDSLAASCGGAHVGIWGRLPGPTEIITLNANCTGTYQPGGVSLTYSLISPTQARIVYSNGSEQTCTYSTNSLHLFLNCGGGNVDYSKNF